MIKLFDFIYVLLLLKYNCALKTPYFSVEWHVISCPFTIGGLHTILLIKTFL